MISEAKLYTVSGPSGVGKTSLVGALLKSVNNVQLSTSYTTRPKRDKEINGEHYYFVDENTFKTMCYTEEFLEYAEIFGHYYGTSREWVNRTLAQQKNIILEIDYQGAKNIRANMPSSIGVFILPHNIEQLKERLFERQQDNSEVIQRRLVQARDEMRYYTNADYLVINDNFDNALSNLCDIFNQVESSKFLRIAEQEKQHADLISFLIHG